MSYADDIEQLSASLPGDRVIRRHRERVRSLRRAVGVSGLFSMVYGNVGSSIYYALGVTAIYALGATPLVFMLAGLFFICTALSYAEGTAAIPEAGGSSSFARRGLNEFWSFFAGWALMLDYIVTIAISAYTAVAYLRHFWPVLKDPHYHVIGAGVVLLILMVLNLRGVQESSRMNVLITIFDLVTQVVLIVLGGILLLNIKTLISQVHWGVAPTWQQLLFSLSIVMVAFTGIETVSNMAEEAQEPSKTVPKAIYLCVAVVLFMYLGISSIALSAMPVVQEGGKWTTELATKWLDDPVAGIAQKLPIAGEFMTFWVAFLAFTILVIATNAGLLGISRLTYSMGLYQQLPPFLAKIHKRFRTPYIAIIIFTVLAFLLILPADITKLADAYSFGAMLAYAIANVAVIALRIREPDLHRPVKMKPNIKIAGKEIPITAVIGAFSCFAVWIAVVWTHHYGRAIGFPFIIIGVILYMLYRKSKKLPITKTVVKANLR